MVNVEAARKVKLDEDYSDFASLLLCPRCKGFYLHQGRITVFERSEDSKDTARITVDGSRAAVESVPNAGSGNPSSRRHGLTIQFECEHCEVDGQTDVLELTIAQHKGTTEVGWRLAPLPSKPR